MTFQHTTVIFFFLSVSMLGFGFYAASQNDVLENEITQLKIDLEAERALSESLALKLSICEGNKTLEKLKRGNELLKKANEDADKLLNEFK